MWYLFLVLISAPTGVSHTHQLNTYTGVNAHNECILDRDRIQQDMEYTYPKGTVYKLQCVFMSEA